MSFFAAAHDFDINCTNITNIQGDQNQTIHNDNRHIVGSHNTYNTTNTSSNNSQSRWSNVDERNDNRRTNTHAHFQAAMFGAQHFHSDPNLAQPTAHPRQDVTGYDDPRDQTHQSGYAVNTQRDELENFRYEFSRGAHAGYSRPRGRSYSYVHPQPYCSNPPFHDPRLFSPPRPPASAPPAQFPIESAESYRSRNLNPLSQIHSQIRSEPYPDQAYPQSMYQHQHVPVFSQKGQSPHPVHSYPSSNNSFNRTVPSKSAMADSTDELNENGTNTEDDNEAHSS